jgi:hypothetical protein
MSTSNPQPAATPNPPPAPVAVTVVAPQPAKRQLIVVSHSSLFYWWPVWAIGFVFTIISFFGDVLATVPHGTKVEKRVVVPNYDNPRTVLVFPKDLPKDPNDLKDPFIHISHSKNVGVVFLAVLLLVILITNIPLRGVWSFVVILIVLFTIIILALLDKWGIIFEYLGFLDIRINAAGYLVFSCVLCTLWLVVFFFFDQQIYMVFEPGQMRVRQSIGDAEMSFDTTGMTTQKQRSDLFRHWILGLGSGDLIVKTAGAHPQAIDMNNVLFIGRKHREIEEMLRSREVVTGNNS